MEGQHKPTCAVIHQGETYTGKQAFAYFAGIPAENCGAQEICMHLLTISKKSSLANKAPTGEYKMTVIYKQYFSRSLRLRQYTPDW